MISYTAKRLSLNQVNIYDNGDQPISSISWPTVQIWSCENAVIGDPYYQDKNLGSYPSLTIKGTKLIARRKLLTNKFFGNEYQISLWDENSQSNISAFRPGWISEKTKINYNGQTYLLSRKNFFRFHFLLQQTESEISRFTDTTPFFNFSSYRRFLITLDALVDPVLLTFSFFLAHNAFY